MAHFCSSCNCGISKQQAEVTERTLTKCLCEKCAAAENAQSAEQFSPQYINIEMLKQLENAGYKVQGWMAEKKLDNQYVLKIEFKELPLIVKFEKPNKSVVSVSDYVSGNGTVDDELSKVKGMVEQASRKTDPPKNGAGDKKKEMPVPEPKQSDHVNPDGPVEPEPVHASNLIEFIKNYVGNDVLEVFGDTGSGKSKFGLEVARQAIAAGKTVFYLDTERNLTDKDIASLRGCQYKYTPILDEIDRIVMRELPKVDVVILDSIGFPVLTSYARLNMKQKGDALLKLIAIFGDLKAWAYKNNGIAIVTNQPESEFNKEPGHVLRPFGDKSQFAAKEIWKTEITQRTESRTKISIKAFRSRSVGHGARIAAMEITGNGVEIQVVS